MHCGPPTQIVGGSDHTATHKKTTECTQQCWHSMFWQLSSLAKESGWLIFTRAHTINLTAIYQWPDCGARNPTFHHSLSCDLHRTDDKLWGEIPPISPTLPIPTNCKKSYRICQNNLDKYQKYFSSVDVTITPHLTPLNSIVWRPCIMTHHTLIPSLKPHHCIFQVYRVVPERKFGDEWSGYVYRPDAISVNQWRLRLVNSTLPLI